MKISTYYILIIALSFLASSLIPFVIDPGIDEEELFAFVILGTVGIPLFVFIYRNSPKKIDVESSQSFNIKLPSKKFWAKEFIILLITLSIIGFGVLYTENVIDDLNEQIAEIENSIEEDYVKKVYDYLEKNKSRYSKRIRLKQFRKNVIENNVMTYDYDGYGNRRKKYIDFGGEEKYIDAVYTNIKFLDDKALTLSREDFYRRMKKWTFEKVDEQKEFEKEKDIIRSKKWPIRNKNEIFIGIVLAIVYPFRLLIFLLYSSIKVLKQGT